MVQCNAAIIIVSAIKETSRNKLYQELYLESCFLSKTKIDENFPNQKFNISNYKTFCRERNKHGGGLLFYISENIPCKLINDEIIPSDIKMTMFEFLFKTRKKPCIGLCKSPS